MQFKTQGTHRKSHEDWGFNFGSASPCIMFHIGRRIRLVDHGDDFIALAFEADLGWHRSKVTERFEAMLEVGRGTHDERSTRVLHRISHWISEVIDYEADQDMQK